MICRGGVKIFSYSIFRITENTNFLLKFIDLKNEKGTFAETNKRSEFIIFAMESVTATTIAAMIAKPSIAFNDFAGTAGDVTSRSVHGRTILSHKAYQDKTKTPAQAVSRNALAQSAGVSVRVSGIRQGYSSSGCCRPVPELPLFCGQMGIHLAFNGGIQNRFQKRSKCPVFPEQAFA